MVTDNRIPNRTIEDARLIFRNFSGKEQKYNREGDRNFCVILDPRTAEDMEREGWNVKQLKAREEGDVGDYYVKVKITYREGQREPAVTLLNGRGGRTLLHEDGIDILDWVDIKYVDLILNPWVWVNGDDTGVSAYLHRIFVTIQQDELEAKYDNIANETLGSAQSATISSPSYSGEEDNND